MAWSQETVSEISTQQIHPLRPVTTIIVGIIAIEQPTKDMIGISVAQYIVIICVLITNYDIALFFWFVQTRPSTPSTTWLNCHRRKCLRYIKPQPYQIPPKVAECAG